MTSKFEGIPFADITGPADPSEVERGRRGRSFDPLFLFLAIDLCLLHFGLLLTSMGGYTGLTNGWPIWRDDHPLYYHSALVTRAFLDRSGTTAGYDPSFMSGYAKSVVFPSSSTLPEVVFYLVRGVSPELLYKIYVLAAGALPPFLMLAAAGVWGGNARAKFLTVLGYLLYVWGDFPISYVGFGMLPYFLSIPLSLLAAGVVCKYLEKGGAGRWLLSALLISASFLCHLTTAMILAPTLLLAYSVTLIARKSSDPPFPISRHLGFWLIPLFALALNAFWWLPGIDLASTKGPSDFAFAHPEGVMKRFKQILLNESPHQTILIGLSLAGLAALRCRALPLMVGLIAFALSGFFWGYLAGEYRWLDFLQPGRHTYAFYSALVIASALGLDEVLTRLRGAKVGRLDLLVSVGMCFLALRIYVPLMDVMARPKIFGAVPILVCRPPKPLVWVIDRVKKHVKPGERLLYEEGGFAVQGQSDPFNPGRFSGLLPTLLKVELLGGPYLHASLETNFTQFGEGKLFGKADWTRDDFVRYARLYRPSAILCWSHKAKVFCASNPDLIEMLETDGVLLIAKIKGFGGDTIDGSAEVDAQPGRLVVKAMRGGVDGSVTLRYHSVPCLRVVPPCAIEEVRLEDDPVPFLKLRPQGDGPVTIDLALPALRKSAPR